MGEKWKQWDFIFLGSKITADVDCSHEIQRCLLPVSYDKSRQCIADNGPYSQSYGFSISRVMMWKLDHKEGWTRKNWYFWTVELEKTLESPLVSKEIKPVNPKGN